MERERLSPIKIEGYQPLREMVYFALREAIMTGKLMPGERLMEVQLAEEMGVSRTPVREAVRRLELDGFVVMIARKGAYVADLSIKDIISVFEVRTAMERLAAQLATERIRPEEIDALERNLAAVEMVDTDDVDNNDKVALYTDIDTKFHDIIYDASRNDRLKQITNNIFEQVYRYRVICLANSKVLLSALDGHHKIVDAIRAKDPMAAGEAAASHMANTQNSLLELMKDKLI